jgi:hypothetical protein
LVRRAYIHIGLPKTGTSYLQQTLWGSRQALAETGVLIPGERHQIQRHAIWDLMGRRLRGVGQPEIAGSWPALVDTVQAWAGDTVLLSEEFLVHARRRHVRQIVDAFGQAEIHVVVTVRDLNRAIGSMWQQEVAKQLTMPWPEYVAAVRNPSNAKSMAGIAFWLRYDLEKILATWETAIPRERIHVLTVPPAGSPATVLLERFAQATGIEYDALTRADGPVNPAVGVMGTEVLLRLNHDLASLDERQYLHLMRVLRKGLAQAPDVKQPSLPSSERAWAARKADEVIGWLDSGGYDVVGDLTDLLPPTKESTADDWQPVADRQLAETALAALAHLSKHHASYWSQTRRFGGAADVDARTRFASARRAFSYRIRAAGLRAADRNELLARGAAFYFRRFSRKT